MMKHANLSNCICSTHLNGLLHFATLVFDFLRVQVGQVVIVPHALMPHKATCKESQVAPAQLCPQIFRWQRKVGRIYRKMMGKWN